MANHPLRGVYRDSQGNAIASPTVTAYEAGTSTLATIFSDRTGTAQANPFTGDTDGEWEFYAASGQSLKIKVEKAGFGTWEKDWIEVGFDVTETDALYYQKDQFTATSTGVADAAKAVLLDSTGKIDASMIEDSDIDHGTVGGLGDDDHTQYALLAGRAGGQTILQALTVEDGFVVNDLGDDHDTRIEGANEANLLFLDASTDRAGIGTATPAERLHVLLTSGAVKFLVETLTADTTDLQVKNSVRSWLWRCAASGNFSLIDTTTNFFPIRVVAGSPSNVMVIEAGGVAFGAAGSYGGGVKVIFVANATTRPSTVPVDGVILSAEDSAAGAANLIVYNESGQRVRLTGVDARVAANFDKTDTTLANVTGLSFNVEAGKTYSFEARLLFDATAGGGHKYAIAGTATATAIAYQINSIANATSAFVITSRQTALAGSAGQAGATAGFTRITGTITVNAAGTLTTQFAQNAASGTSSILRGSTFHLREIT